MRPIPFLCIAVSTRRKNRQPERTTILPERTDSYDKVENTNGKYSVASGLFTLADTETDKRPIENGLCRIVWDFSSLSPSVSVTGSVNEPSEQLTLY